jgi:hypothetical protein
VARGGRIWPPVAVATALDAEFRCALPEGTGWLRRLLGSGPGALLSPAGGGESDAVNAARLACGVWVGNVQGEAAALTDWVSELGGEPTVLTGSRAAGPQDPSTILSELARGGRDGLGATRGLVPVGGAELLAEAAAGGEPPVAIRLERPV